MQFSHRVLLLCLAYWATRRSSRRAAKKSAEFSVRDSKLSVGGIVGAVICSIVVALAIAAFAVNHRRRKRCELYDSNLSEDIKAGEVNADVSNVEEWLDEDESGSRRVGRAATSTSLAAMGAASLVTTQLISPGNDAGAHNERQAPQKSIIDGSAMATQLTTGGK